MVTRFSKTARTQFIPIYLDSLKLDSLLKFNLYVKIDRQMVLYRSSDLPFTERTKRKLMENGVVMLYIDSDSKAEFQEYLEQNLGEILNDPEVPEPKKAGILYETSKSLIEDPNKAKEKVSRNNTPPGKTASHHASRK